MTSTMVQGSEPRALRLNRTELEKLGPSDGNVMDAILPWMKGFEKRFHPEEHEYDIVKCICGFSCPDSEETREMVQCDQCSLWQHIPCLRIKKNDIPLDYFCHNCLPERHTHLFRSPTKSARSSKLTGKKSRSEAAERTINRTPTRSGRTATTMRQRPSESIQSVDEEALDEDLKLIKSGSSMILDPDGPLEDIPESKKRRRRPSARARSSYTLESETSEMMSLDEFLVATRMSLSDMEAYQKEADALLYQYGLDNGVEKSWSEVNQHAKAAAYRMLESSRTDLPSFAPLWILQHAWHERRLVRQSRPALPKTTLTFRITKPKLDHVVK